VWEQHSCPTPGPVGAWMDDGFWTDKLSQYVTNYPDQLSLPSL